MPVDWCLERLAFRQDMIREEEAQRMGYLMPCTAVEKLSGPQQISRTSNELIEVWDAYDAYIENNCQPQYRKALLMECVDVQVCMETLMHNLGADETERAEMRRAVWEKNNARGYYDGKTD